MRARRLVLLVLATLPGAPVARAAAPEVPTTGPLLAVRAGVGVPQGGISRGAPDVRDVVARKVPLGFELGYRLSRRVWGELQFEIAPAWAASSLCAAGTSCSASQVRFGLALQLRLLPDRRVDPWVGLGAGVEVLNAEGLDAATAARTEWSWAGLELPFIEAGLDVAVSRQVGVGPWASVGFGRFTSESVRPEGGTTVSGAVHGRTTHRWFTVGLRATLKL
ncbi:MAG TPA: hypothetical protein VF912_09460 [Anaeromyxobacter sp.]